MQLPSFIKKNIHFANIDPEKDLKSVVLYVFKNWDLKSLKWVLNNIPKDVLIDSVKNPLKWEWDKKSYNFLAKLIWVEVDDKVKKIAIKNLNSF